MVRVDILGDCGIYHNNFIATGVLYNSYIYMCFVSMSVVKMDFVLFI